MPKFLTRFYPDLIFIITLVACSILLTKNLINVLDIGLYDESDYLYYGVNLFNSNSKVDAQWSPIYLLWYFVLSIFQKDNILLYYLNYTVLSIVSSLSFYLFFRTVKINQVLSFYGSFIYLISIFNIPIWPKVSTLTLVVLLIGFCFISKASSLILESAGYFILSLLLSYLRPEFALTSIIIIALYLFTSIRKTILTRQISKSLMVSSSFLIIFLMITLIFGNPLEGGRSIIAFGQHFSVNYVQWSNADLDPWVDWEQIMEMNFGNANSVKSALFNNPLAFARHCFLNVIETLKTIINGSGLGVLFMQLILIAATAVGLIWMYLNRTISLNKVISYIKKVINNNFIVMFFLIPPTLSSIIIYPRLHYILFLWFAYLFLILFTSQITLNKFLTLTFFNRYLSVKKTWKVKFFIPLFFGLTIIFLLPQFSWFKPVDANEANLLGNQKTIYALKSLNLNNTVNILEAEGGYHIYLGEEYSRVPHYDKDAEMSCNELIKEREVNVIIISPRLSNDVRYRNVPDCQKIFDLAKNAEIVEINNSDFKVLKVEGTDRKIVYKE